MSWEYFVIRKTRDEKAWETEGGDQAAQESATSANMRDLVSMLNALGSQGWEVCGTEGNAIVFKRPTVQDA